MLRVLAAFVLCLSTIGGGRVVQAYPGSLDPSFGSTGVIHWAALSGHVLSQPDGNVIVTGASDASGRVFRFDGAGVPDPSFGTDGAASTSPVSNPIGAVLQSGGNIVVAGGTSVPGECALVRVDAQGELDPTFGSGGVVTPPLACGELIRGTDDTIVVAGRLSDPTKGTTALAMARYDHDGNPDGSFGTGGLVVEDFGGDWLLVGALLVQPDGGIVVAGTMRSAAVLYTLALARFDANGTLDPSFGEGGATRVEFGASSSFGVGVVQMPDDTLIAAADGHGSSQFLLARVNADGSPDTTFGADGVVMGPAGAEAKGIVRETDGNLVVIGYAYGTPAGHIRLARYHPDGTLDATFGIDGTADTVSLGLAPYGVAIDQENRILVAGYTFVARYLTSGTPLTHCQPIGPGSVPECVDGNPCTWDFCDGLTHVCNTQPIAFVPCEVDDNECTQGYCSPAGECVERATGPVSCTDDGNPCTIDRCAAYPGTHQVYCSHVADIEYASCTQPGVQGAATLSIIDVPGSTPGHHVRFHWSHGDATKSDFGKPGAGTSYRFCVFRSDIGTILPTRIGARIEGSASCTASGCWRERVHGWKFRSTGTPDGIVRLSLSEGARTGLGRIDLKGVGPALHLPTLPFPFGLLHVQVHSSDGRCWDANFYDFTRNTPVSFYARSG